MCRPGRAVPRQYFRTKGEKQMRRFEKILIPVDLGGGEFVAGGAAHGRRPGATHRWRVACCHRRSRGAPAAGLASRRLQQQDDVVRQRAIGEADRNQCAGTDVGPATRTSGHYLQRDSEACKGDRYRFDHHGFPPARAEGFPARSQCGEGRTSCRLSGIGHSLIAVIFNFPKIRMQQVR